MEYPDGHPGVYPLDPETPVGQFRLVFGDIDSEPYDPVEQGFQSYGELSDAEIEAFLSQGGGSINRGIGYYYLSLSGAAAKESRMVQDYDLRIDSTKRAADLRAVAMGWFDLATQEDLGVAEDAFEIIPTGTRGGQFIPEATHPQWGRSYTWERWH